MEEYRLGIARTPCERAKAVGRRSANFDAIDRAIEFPFLRDWDRPRFAPGVPAQGSNHITPRCFAHSVQRLALDLHGVDRSCGDHVDHLHQMEAALHRAEPLSNTGLRIVAV